MELYARILYERDIIFIKKDFSLSSICIRTLHIVTYTIMWCIINYYLYSTYTYIIIYVYINIHLYRVLYKFHWNSRHLEKTTKVFPKIVKYIFYRNMGKKSCYLSHSWLTVLCGINKIQIETNSKNTLMMIQKLRFQLKTIIRLWKSSANVIAWYYQSVKYTDLKNFR